METAVGCVRVWKKPLNMESHRTRVGIANPGRPKPENILGLKVPTHIGSAMRRGGLSLRRVSASNNNKGFQDLRPFCAHTWKSMAEEVTTNSQPLESKSEESGVVKTTTKEEESKKLPPPPPPPPEKPLPGDCCGSGCVQCVWDLYYEELEAYNKLYKSDS